MLSARLLVVKGWTCLAGAVNTELGACPVAVVIPRLCSQDGNARWRCRDGDIGLCQCLSGTQKDASPLNEEESRSARG